MDIHWKFYGDRPRATPPPAELKTRGVAKYSDFRPIDGVSRKRCKIEGKLLLITNRKTYMSFRLVQKSVTLNDLERRNGVILRCFSEFGYLPGALRKCSRSLSHLLMSSCSYKWSVYSYWHMLSRANSANVGFRPVVRLFAAPANPTHAPRTENPFYKFGKKLLWVSTMCAQILWFSRVSVRVYG